MILNNITQKIANDPAGFGGNIKFYLGQGLTPPAVTDVSIQTPTGGETSISPYPFVISKNTSAYAGKYELVGDGVFNYGIEFEISGYVDSGAQSTYYGASNIEIGFGDNLDDLMSRHTDTDIIFTDNLLLLSNVQFKFIPNPSIGPIIINSINYGGRLIWFKESVAKINAPVLTPYAVDGSAIISNSDIIQSVPSTAFIIPNLQKIYTPGTNEASSGFILNADQANFAGGITAIYLRADSIDGDGTKSNCCAVIALDVPIPKTSSNELHMNDLIKSTWDVV